MFSDQCCYLSTTTRFCTPAYHVCVLKTTVNILRITVLKLSSGIEIIIFLFGFLLSQMIFALCP